MGYGLAKTNVFPDNLQYTKFKTISSQECIPAYANGSIPQAGLICAKGLLSSICFGDMGDPLVSALSGRLLGIAVSTWGDCEVNHPQTYIDVVPYMSWIIKIMNDFRFEEHIPKRI